MLLSVFLGRIVLLVSLVIFQAGPSSAPSKHVDQILMVKSKRTMSLTTGPEVLKTYKLALGRQPLAPKDRQGDHKTLEGIYSIDRKLPNSRFHKALHISYPSRADRENANRLEVAPGGDVEIHGFGYIPRMDRLPASVDGLD